MSGDVEKRTPGEEGVRPATPLPLAMEETVVVWVVESHSSCRTSSRRLMFLRAGSGAKGWKRAGREYAPDEVELDDGLPSGAFLGKVLRRERELEVCGGVSRNAC